jgi:hypothetical protein
MNRITTIMLTILLAAVAPATVAVAQDAPAPAAAAPKGPDSVIVTPAVVTEALAEANAGEGRMNQMKRVVQALDSQLRAALGGTNKFKVIVGSNMKEVTDEIVRQRTSGLFDSNNPDYRGIGNLQPPKYQVVPRIDDFQDIAESTTLEGQGLEMTARTLRMSLVVSIIDANGTEVEHASIEVNSPRQVIRRAGGIRASGDATDALLLGMAKEASIKIADRLIDVVYPAKVAAVNDKEVTINRGDGTSIAVGQLYDVFFMGGVVTDPDTGAVLGKEETKVGVVEITSVQPKFSKGKILDNNGIDRGHILRLQQDGGVPPAEQKQ